MTQLEHMVQDEAKAHHDKILHHCNVVIELGIKISVGIQDGLPRNTIRLWREKRDFSEQELVELWGGEEPTLFLFTASDGVRYVGEVIMGHVYFSQFEELQTFGPAIPGASEG